MRLSKDAKARVKRLNGADRKSVMKAAQLLADNDMITSQRYLAIYRTLNNSAKLC